MAGPLPNVPTNFLVQPGNGLVYLSWSPVVSSSASYNVLRSVDSVNYFQIANTSGIAYSDITASSGIVYYYEVQAVNPNGTSNPTSPLTATLVQYGQVSLGQVRLAAQQRADMVNNGFVTTQEWNSYINHSYNELYDLLVTTYGDEYYVANPYVFTTDGRFPALYPLPNNMYKLLGVDLGISSGQNAFVTLKKFPFISRNNQIYGNTPASFLGILNLKYRLLGTNIEFIPQPASNQTCQLWYVPRPVTLLADSDILDGISGWDEYIIVDVAIKALQKEESDVQVLMAQKQALKLRIEGTAANRDIGMPEVVSDVRRMDGSMWGDPFNSGPVGGW